MEVLPKIQGHKACLEAGLDLGSRESTPCPLSTHSLRHEFSVLPHREGDRP